MTTHEARRRLKRMHRKARQWQQFSPDVRDHVKWAQDLNRPEPQDSKAADAAERKYTP